MWLRLGRLRVGVGVRMGSRLGRGCDDSRWSMACVCVDSQCGSLAPTKHVGGLVGWLGDGTLRVEKVPGWSLRRADAGGEAAQYSGDQCAHAVKSDAALRGRGCGCGWLGEKHTQQRSQQHTASAQQPRTTDGADAKGQQTQRHSGLFRRAKCDGDLQTGSLKRLSLPGERCSRVNGQRQPSLPDRTAHCLEHPRSSEDDSKISRSQVPPRPGQGKQMGKWGIGRSQPFHVIRRGEEKWCGWDWLGLGPRVP